MDSKHHGTMEDGKPESPVPAKPKPESTNFSFSSESSIEFEDDDKFEPDKTVFSVESATLSLPPIPGSYDPGRIPASVFSSKPTTPMDWSVASNESLFSIHEGNSSFSRDHVFMLFKSEELPKLDDYIIVPPSAIETDLTERQSIDLGKDHREGKFAENAQSKSTQNTKPNQLDTQEKVDNADTLPVTREEIRISTSSVQSFHFPLLDSDMGKDHYAKRGFFKQNYEKKIHQQVHFQNHGTRTTTTTKSGWFSCFTCCTFDS